MINKTINWINAVLTNNEISTDNELFNYFKENGLKETLINNILRYRNIALQKPLIFDIEDFISRIDLLENEIKKL